MNIRKELNFCKKTTTIATATYCFCLTGLFFPVITPGEAGSPNIGTDFGFGVLQRSSNGLLKQTNRRNHSSCVQAIGVIT